MTTRSRTSSGHGQPTVLVLGGTGHYGGAIVRNLSARGVPVRVFTRHAARARALLPASVEVLEGDLAAADTVRSAMRGVGRLIVAVSAFDRRQIRSMAAIERDAVIRALGEAARAGVHQVVYLSAFEIRQDAAERLRIPHAAIKADVERHLQDSRLNWTVLGAPPSTEIFFAMTRGDRMVVPGGGPPRLPTISPVDLGEIAAQTALRDDLAGRRIRVAGPEPMSFAEAARRMGAVRGHPVRFVAVPLGLPIVAWHLTRPFAPYSRTLCFVHTMLAYVRLLNGFPPDLADGAIEDHRLLRRTFPYEPTTLEMDVRRRFRL